MTNYQVKFYSKDKKSLDNFLKFIKYNNKTQNIELFISLLKKKRKKKRITVLKSPHVNKSAQEHFEYTIYSIKISFYLWKIKKYLVLLKKVRNQLFPDLKMKIVGKFSKKKSVIVNQKFNIKNIAFYACTYCLKQNLKYKKFKTNNLTFKNSLCNSNKNLLRRTELYLKVLDYYGKS